MACLLDFIFSRLLAGVPVVSGSDIQDLFLRTSGVEVFLVISSMSLFSQPHGSNISTSSSIPLTYLNTRRSLVETPFSLMKSSQPGWITSFSFNLESPTCHVAPLGRLSLIKLPSSSGMCGVSLSGKVCVDAVYRLVMRTKR